MAKSRLRKQSKIKVVDKPRHDLGKKIQLFELSPKVRNAFSMTDNIETESKPQAQNKKNYKKYKKKK